MANAFGEHKLHSHHDNCHMGIPSFPFPHLVIGQPLELLYLYELPDSLMQNGHVYPLACNNPNPSSTLQTSKVWHQPVHKNSHLQGLQIPPLGRYPSCPPGPSKCTRLEPSPDPVLLNRFHLSKGKQRDHRPKVHQLHGQLDRSPLLHLIASG